MHTNWLRNHPIDVKQLFLWRKLHRQRVSTATSASILRTAGLAGDLITALTGKPFYITSSRYRSMVTDYVTPMDKTYTVLGAPKISLEQGVKETLTWLRTQPEFADVPPVSKT